MDEIYENLIQRLVDRAVSQAEKRGVEGRRYGVTSDWKEITIGYGPGEERGAMRVVESDEDEFKELNMSTEEQVRDAAAMVLAGVSAFGGVLNVNWKTLGYALLSTVELFDTLGM